MTLGLIWAQAANGVIGDRGGLPWHLPEDLAHFRRTTTGATVVMGRRTWQSLPPRFRPLPGRRNMVLTRDPGFSADGADVVPDFDAVLALAADEVVWVIGGEQVYAALLPHAELVVRTELADPVDGDAVAPALDPGRWRLAGREPPEDGWAESATGLRYRVSRFTAAT